MLNEINCKPKRWRKSKKKLKSFNFLTTEKTNQPKKTCDINRCQDNTRIILTRIWRIWTQCEEHRNKNTFLIFESWKSKYKNQEKHISLFSIRDIEKLASHLIQMIYLPEENKKIGKRKIQTYETLKYFAKKWSKKLHSWNSFYCFSKT